MRGFRKAPDGSTEQRLGTDRTILFEDGTEWTVEEKLRRRPYSKSAEPDILIELWHDRTDGKPGKPGWGLKPPSAEYMAFIWVPDRKIVMLRTEHVHKAALWIRKQTFKHLRHLNCGYETINARMPVEKFRKVIVAANVEV